MTWKPIRKAKRAQKAEKNVVGYSLRDKNGKRVYTGITNNPRARKAEHQVDGKRYGYFQIETEPMTRKDAEQWERRSLKGSRQRTGKNPKYNKTSTGQYQPGNRRSQGRRRRQ